MPAVDVELLTVPGCPHAEGARAVVLSVLQEMGQPFDLSEIVVGDQSAAASYGFRGSPSVRVGGRDVEGSGAGEVGLACRRYRQPDGSVRGAPSRVAITTAIEDWREQQRSLPEAGGRGGATQWPARALRAGFLWASQRRSLERLATSNGLTRRLVHRFVAGETLDEAIESVAQLHAGGFRTTLDLLGESVDTEAVADRAAGAYVEALRALDAHGLDGNVSLKLTAMGLDLGREACVARVSRVVEEARRSGSFVRVDMEDHARTDATLAIARELHASYPGVGVVIQSYLRRSAADVAALNAQGIRVRLCKGAYNEPPTVAFATKAEVDGSYRALTESLLRDGTCPGIATHDEGMVDHALAFAQREGIGPERFEFQMLYGIRRDLQERLVREGWNVRVYVPYGGEWYPYFMRRLAERPANVLFILRSLARERRAGAATAG